MFFEHAGSAVAVDLATRDVTDVFSTGDISPDATWTSPTDTTEVRQATLVARSMLAAKTDPLRQFTVPAEVRNNARQAALWKDIYNREIDLPVVASVVSLVPPDVVQQAARRALGMSNLPPYTRARAAQLCSGRVVPARLAQQMHTYFSRHRKEEVGEAAWLAWGGDAGRAWATKVAGAADDGASTLNKKLADSETIDYDTLRLLPRAFAATGSPHTAECDGNGDCSCGGSRASSAYPSVRALTYLALGGDAGREWSSRVLRRHEARGAARRRPAPGHRCRAHRRGGDRRPVGPRRDRPARLLPRSTRTPPSASTAGRASCTSSTTTTRSTTSWPTSPPRTRTTSPGAQTTQRPARSAASPSTTPCTSRRRWRRTTSTRTTSTPSSPRTRSSGRARARGVTAGGAHFGVDWIEDEYPGERDVFDRVDSLDQDIDRSSGSAAAARTTTR